MLSSRPTVAKATETGPSHRNHAGVRSVDLALARIFDGLHFSAMIVCARHLALSELGALHTTLNDVEAKEEDVQDLSKKQRPGEPRLSLLLASITNAVA